MLSWNLNFIPYDFGHSHKDVEHGTNFKLSKDIYIYFYNSIYIIIGYSKKSFFCIV